MNVSELVHLLDSHRDAALHIMLPSGEFVPAHFHVTEVGRVEKRFIDCGGTRRESVSCLVQTWTADDHDHRLRAGRLSQIFGLAQPVLESSDLPVEFEFGADVASQYQLADVEVTPKGLLFVLAGKQTQCLAPDRCGTQGCC